MSWKVTSLEIPSLAPDESFTFACGLARNYKKPHKLRGAFLLGAPMSNLFHEFLFILIHQVGKRVDYKVNSDRNDKENNKNFHNKPPSAKRRLVVGWRQNQCPPARYQKNI